MPIHQFKYILIERAACLAFLSLTAGHGWSYAREHFNISQERLKARNRMANIENELAKFKGINRK
jgi:hypothetical protein